MAAAEIKLIEDERRQATALRLHVLANVSARTCACAAVGLAALSMVFNRQTATVNDAVVHADYDTISTYKFFIAGNALVCAYCLISLTNVVAFQGKTFIIHILDLLMLLAAATAWAAAAAVTYVAKFGEGKAGWTPVCRHFAGYCDRVFATLVVDFIGVACCFWFSIMQPPRLWNLKAAPPRKTGAAGDDGVA